HLAAQEAGLPMAAPPLDPSADAEAMARELGEIVRDFCERVERGKRSHNEALKVRVLQYIQEHFQDSGLYGAAVADQAGISEKYLYNFIKEQTGQSVGEYIQSLRMGLALKLLEEGTEAVSQIYAKVGFNSNNSFYKAFKRAYGVSPSQYRDARRACAGGKGRM
ncbi:MAG TPA: AraC family transcriptional regulator, partial [Clostridia bacterium]|nr:AraC family transcriptional regulator [Clostridia bacterium]